MVTSCVKPAAGGGWGRGGEGGFLPELHAIADASRPENLVDCMLGEAPRDIAERHRCDLKQSADDVLASPPVTYTSLTPMALM